ncbi:serine/threonine-protein kinase [Paraliomyxa miuraensis]|uniref:serine/threonine-protein kinase n=1 Tax=Paraliomyxa miuraensis TaxID=376150 RepID=UPI002255DD15|nr:serine/threonine-protein kinase [Paraliomyxa miuraensis]MCX4242196.1 serine/threonine-protein kinase [Paraliomyxa miuraensis]
MTARSSTHHSRETGSLTQTLDATSDGDDTVPSPRSAIDPFDVARGRQLGRYVVLERLGAGAMGVVLAAYDPELDRKVAIKLLHPRERSASGDQGRLRLLAEAQALARLSDPNVVAVHDVGTHDGQVFVAMEFVEGQTLGRWLGGTPRSWQEVLEVMLAAGRGLAAAHARELAHRDFKPDNVMLGSDGRVRVMDFGLARADATTPSGEASSSTGELDASQQRCSALDLALTSPGSMLGTPAYMAPECLGGERGGAIADQFSFCVTLWEGIYGQPPFPAKALPELYARVLEGTIAEPPASRRVPRWLRRVLERGLAVEPERRFPSMHDLLHGLERGRVRTRRARVLGALAGAGVLGVAALGVYHHDRLQQRQACEGEGEAIEEVWNDEIAAAVGETLQATGLAHAGTTLDKARPWLDAQASAWARASTEACVHTEVDHDWDETTAERARWCLDDRRLELEALIAALRRGGAHMVNRVVPATAGLAQVSPCLDAATLARMPAIPSEHRDQLRAVRAELWRVQALHAVGAHDESATVAREALAHAEALGWAPLVAEARVLWGNELEFEAEYAEAERVLEQAYFEASEAEALDVAVAAAKALVGLLGDRLARHREALRWARHAELVLARLPPETSEVRRAHLLTVVSTTHFRLGEYRKARALAEQSLEIDIRHLGHDHPRIAHTMSNLGLFGQAQGEYAEAKALYEDALELQERALGPIHTTIADLCTNLGSVEMRLGHKDRAKGLFQRALEIREAIQGAEHPDVADAVNNLASLHHTLEEPEIALPLFERALRLYEAKLEPGHPSIAGGYNNVGDTLRALGQLERARENLDVALRSWEAALGPDHPDLAYSLQGLSSVAIAQGRFDDAVAKAQRAVALRQAAHVGSDLIAEARVQLVEALWGQGLERQQALAQARLALAEYREHGQAHTEEIAKLERWLTEHEPAPQR